MVLKGLTIDQKPLKDHMEAVGHKEAFDFVSELVKEKSEINERVIKQIHSLVLADKKDDTSTISVISIPAPCTVLIADSRPFPGPFTKAFALRIPKS